MTTDPIIRLNAALEGRYRHGGSPHTTIRLPPTLHFSTPLAALRHDHRTMGIEGCVDLPGPRLRCRLTAPAFLSGETRFR